MKLNVISYDDGFDSSVDCLTFTRTLSQCFRGKTHIEFYNYFDEKNIKCADINIMIGYINNLHFKYAGVNIYVPQLDNWNENWNHFLPKFDFILAKTEICIKKLISLGVSKDKIVNMGWCGIDQNFLPSDTLSKEEMPSLGGNSLEEIYKMLEIKREKSYSNWLLFVGNRECTHLCDVIKLWIANTSIAYPQLHIIIHPKLLEKTLIQIDVKLEDLPNSITLYTKPLKIEEHRNLVNWCGVHLCLNDTKEISNHLMDCLSVKSVAIATKTLVNKKYVNQDYLIHNINQLSNIVNSVWNMSKSNKNKLVELGDENRVLFQKMKGSFVDSFTNSVNQVFGNTSKLRDSYLNYIKWHSGNGHIIPDKKLPPISVITLTRNRQNFFKLAMFNWMNNSYPARKVEWVIVDDSDNQEELTQLGWKSIEAQLPANYIKYNIKYIKLDTRTTIGEKRNLGIEHAKNDIILMMDDDDYYPYNSFKSRVCQLLDKGENGDLNKDIQCVVSTSLSCLEIHKIISFVNVPPHDLPLSKRCSEACLCFYKSFWETQKFSNVDRHEGVGLLEGRENQLSEIESDRVILALLHHGNREYVNLPSEESNGCHFNLGDDIKLLLSNLGKEHTKNTQDIKYRI